MNNSIHFIDVDNIPKCPITRTRDVRYPVPDEYLTISDIRDEILNNSFNGEEEKECSPVDCSRMRRVPSPRFYNPHLYGEDQDAEPKYKYCPIQKKVVLASEVQQGTAETRPIELSDFITDNEMLYPSGFATTTTVSVAAAHDAGSDFAKYSTIPDAIEDCASSENTSSDLPMDLYNEICEYYCEYFPIRHDNYEKDYCGRLVRHLDEKVFDYYNPNLNYPVLFSSQPDGKTYEDYCKYRDSLSLPESTQPVYVPSRLQDRRRMPTPGTFEHKKYMEYWIQEMLYENLQLRDMLNFELWKNDDYRYNDTSVTDCVSQIVDSFDKFDVMPRDLSRITLTRGSNAIDLVGEDSSDSTHSSMPDLVSQFEDDNDDDKYEYNEEAMKNNLLFDDRA